jgi:ABC-type sugar transport system permease subunit
MHAEASTESVRVNRAPPRGARFARRGWSILEVLFVLPLVCLVGLLVIYPAAVGVFRSFYDWNPGYGETTFVGLDNYIELARSPTFHEILRNEAVFVLVGVPIFTVLPLAVALLLYEGVPFPGVFRTIYFFPGVLSAAIIGILFRAILQPDGLLNETLRSAGLGSLASDWTTDPQLVKPVLIGLLAWASMGVGVVVFSAGLSSVPPELFEAAEIDGASWFQRFRYIMLPSLRPLIEFWFVIQVISVFLFIFGWIYVLTQGGPGYASTTLDYDVYTNAFEFAQFGLASAEAVYLLLIVTAVLLLGVALRAVRERRPLQGLTNRLGDSTLGDRLHSARARLRIGVRRGNVLASHRRSSTKALRRLRPRSWSPLRTALAILITIPFVYPFVFLVGTALKTESEFVQDPLGIPDTFTLSHLSFAWNTAELDNATVNSLIAVGVGVAVCVVISSAAAFYFRRNPGPLTRALLTVTVGFWVLPWVIWIIPFFILLSDLGLVNNLVTLGVVYGTMSAPFAVFFLWSYFRNGIPDEVLDASAVDGASALQQFLRVVLPLSVPALATVVALTFVNLWGDLLMAIILLQDAQKFTVTAAAAGLVGQFEFPTQAIAAASLISIAPMLLIFVLAQRAIMRGFTAGIGK